MENKETNKYCPLCGELLNEKDACATEHKFKKMCVNCQHVNYSNDDNCYICNNIENMEEAKKRIIDAAKTAAGGYSFTVEVTPLPLKRPLVKCPRWELSKDVEKNIKNLFE